MTIHQNEIAHLILTPNFSARLHATCVPQIVRQLFTPDCTLHLKARLPRQVSCGGDTRCWSWADGPASGRRKGAAWGRTDGRGTWSAPLHPAGIRVPSLSSRMYQLNGLGMSAQLLFTIAYRNNKSTVCEGANFLKPFNLYIV